MSALDENNGDDDYFDAYHAALDRIAHGGEKALEELSRRVDPFNPDVDHQAVLADLNRVARQVKALIDGARA